MAVTSISNIIDPQVLADQIGAQYPDKLVLGNSDLVEINGTFPLGSPGTKFTLPFWKRIGAFAAISEGTPMTTGAVEAGVEKAIVQRAGGAYAAYDTAQLVSIADPVAEIASQIARRAAEYVDAALVVEAEKTPNSHDISAVSSGLVDQNTFLEATVLKMGDNYEEMLSGGVIFMHSKVFNDLAKTGAIQNNYQSGMDVLRTGRVPMISGMPIKVTDRATKTTVSSVNYYNSYIIGPKSLALFYQRAVQVEFDRDILSLEDIIAANVHFAAHLFGWDDDSNAQAAEDVKSIRVVKVKSK